MLNWQDKKEYGATGCISSSLSLMLRCARTYMEKDRGSVMYGTACLEMRLLIARMKWFSSFIHEYLILSGRRNHPNHRPGLWLSLPTLRWDVRPGGGDAPAAAHPTEESPGLRGWEPDPQDTHHPAGFPQEQAGRWRLHEGKQREFNVIVIQLFVISCFYALLFILQVLVSKFVS